MTDEVKARVDSLSEELSKALKGFIDTRVTDSTLLLVRKAVDDCLSDLRDKQGAHYTIEVEDGGEDKVNCTINVPLEECNRELLERLIECGAKITITATDKET